MVSVLAVEELVSVVSVVAVLSVVTVVPVVSTGGGGMNSSIAPMGIAREIYPRNFKLFHRSKLFRGFK